MEKGICGALIVHGPICSIAHRTGCSSLYPGRGSAAPGEAQSAAGALSSLPQIGSLGGWAIRRRSPKGSRMPGAGADAPVNLFHRYKKLFAPLELTDISPLIRRLRAVKSAYELRQLKEAAALAEAVFAQVKKIYRTGMTELELAAELEAFARTGGHQGAIRMRGFNQEMFYSHTLSGESATVPSFFNGVTGGYGLNPSFPQGASNKKIRPGDLLLIDFVTVVNGYMVDQTRIFCPGEPAPSLLRAHETALQIKRALMKRVDRSQRCRSIPGGRWDRRRCRAGGSFHGGSGEGRLCRARGRPRAR